MTRRGKHLTVHLTGGGPWGFRLTGGAGTSEPLSVYKIRRNSKAHTALFEGDVILTINGLSCDSIDLDKATDVIDDERDTLVIELLRQQVEDNVAPSNMVIESTPGHKTVTRQEYSRQFHKKIIKESSDFGHASVSVPVQLEQHFTVQNGVQRKIPLASETIKDSKQDASLKKAESKPPTTDVSSVGLKDSVIRDFNQEVICDDKKYVKKTSETLFEKQGHIETRKQSTKEHSYVKNDDLHQLDDVQSKIKPGVLFSKEFDFPTNSGRSRIISEQPTEIEKTSNTEILSEESPGYAKLFKVKKYESTTSTKKSSFWDPLASSALSAPKGGVPIFNMDKPNTIATMFPSCTGSVEEKEKKPSSTDQGTGHYYEAIPDAGTVSYATFPRKKKMYSSSAFYEGSSTKYPTVEEQVELCRRIADSLSDDKKSHGASMFNRRVEKSNKWGHKDQETDTGPCKKEMLKEVKLTGQVKAEPTRSEANSSKEGDTPPKLKTILDPRHLQDASQLRKEGQNISEHNVVSPEVCLDLVKDLKSPAGKGAVMFAKRQKKSEKWIVDENKVKAHHPPQKPLNPLSTEVTKTGPQTTKLQEMMQSPRLKIVKSPWKAALESPIGSCDGAFQEVQSEFKPEPSASSDVQAGRIKAQPPSSTTPSDSFVPPSSTTVPSLAPVVGSRFLPSTNYGLYRPSAPKGWSGQTKVSTSSTTPQPLGSEQASTPSDRIPPSTPQKMPFRNFNNTPKTWSAAKATPEQFVYKPVKVKLGFMK
ncbi:uncharacterized protein LOC143244925 isoform X2 [Tachypleus tridentatus]|uniref:uncharacterized protein LOC143244925 isoform X2 n=1 Tax=Tachypleus tridentatus TaxID=6853 RepID=UPI003FD008C7